MNQSISVLIIDDHPIIIEAYSSALEYLDNKNSTLKFHITSSTTTDDAIKKITLSNFDIIFLDIKMPSSSDNSVLSGEDLGLKIKDVLPNAKIVVSTMFNDNSRINSIFKALDPDAFLIKDDITKSTIISAIKSVLKEEPFYSRTVLKLLRKIAKNDYTLDRIDRQILYYLSKGIRTKDLSKFVPLSAAGIEKRKRKIKTNFEIENFDDNELLKVAEEKGFI